MLAKHKIILSWPYTVYIIFLNKNTKVLLKVMNMCIYMNVYKNLVIVLCTNISTD